MDAPGKIRRIVIVDTDVYEQVCLIAKREHRSVSAQMAHFLAAAVARDRDAQNQQPVGLTAHGGLTP